MNATIGQWADQPQSCTPLFRGLEGSPQQYADAAYAAFCSTGFRLTPGAGFPIAECFDHLVLLDLERIAVKGKSMSQDHRIQEAVKWFRQLASK